jgi:hypothetical protein
MVSQVEIKSVELNDITFNLCWNAGMYAKLVLWYECLCDDSVFPFYFTTLEMNTAREEEEYFEGVEEEKVQGHIADQGKPSKLVASLILVVFIA